MNFLRYHYGIIKRKLSYALHQNTPWASSPCTYLWFMRVPLIGLSALSTLWDGHCTFEIFSHCLKMDSKQVSEMYEHMLVSCDMFLKIPMKITINPGTGPIVSENENAPCCRSVRQVIRWLRLSCPTYRSRASTPGHCLIKSLVGDPWITNLDWSSKTNPWPNSQKLLVMLWCAMILAYRHQINWCLLPHRSMVTSPFAYWFAHSHSYRGL